MSSWFERSVPTQSSLADHDLAMFYAPMLCQNLPELCSESEYMSYDRAIARARPMSHLKHQSPPRGWSFERTDQIKKHVAEFEALNELGAKRSDVLTIAVHSTSMKVSMEEPDASPHRHFIYRVGSLELTSAGRTRSRAGREGGQRA